MEAFRKTIKKYGIWFLVLTIGAVVMMTVWSASPQGIQKKMETIVEDHSEPTQSQNTEGP